MNYEENSNENQDNYSKAAYQEIGKATIKSVAIRNKGILAPQIKKYHKNIHEKILNAPTNEAHIHDTYQKKAYWNKAK